MELTKGVVNQWWTHPGESFLVGYSSIGYAVIGVRHGATLTSKRPFGYKISKCPVFHTLHPSIVESVYPNMILGAFHWNEVEFAKPIVNFNVVAPAKKSLDDLAKEVQDLLRQDLAAQAAKVDMSRYPIKCPGCKGPAYQPFTGPLDCFNKCKG